MPARLAQHAQQEQARCRRCRHGLGQEHLPAVGGLVHERHDEPRIDDLCGDRDPGSGRQALDALEVPARVQSGGGREGPGQQRQPRVVAEGRHGHDRHQREAHADGQQQTGRGQDRGDGRRQLRGVVPEARHLPRREQAEAEFPDDAEPVAEGLREDDEAEGGCAQRACEIRQDQQGDRQAGRGCDIERPDVARYRVLCGGPQPEAHTLRPRRASPARGIRREGATARSPGAARWRASARTRPAAARQRPGEAGRRRQVPAARTSAQPAQPSSAAASRRPGSLDAACLARR